MVQYTYASTPLDTYAGGEQPCVIVPRGAGELWYAPSQPVQVGQPVTWQICQKAEHACLPLFPYLVAAAPEALAAFVFQLANWATLQKPPAVVQRVHIVVGTPVHIVQRAGQTIQQLQLGFGFVGEANDRHGVAKTTFERVT
jgi:hypothetical protein